ncbi:MAG TPA: hypothetical protein VHB68_11580 [Steroidobacteraceae bacterium]|nr:hypothetical protein [Steroidobacteraceae bacterium]
MSEHILGHLAGVDRNLGGLIRAVGPYGLVLETECHPFESLAQAIAYQQLHANAARAIFSRFVTAVGGGAFPTPQAVVAAPEATLRAAGLSGSKIAALRDLAAKTIEGVVPDRKTLVLLEDAEIIARLTAVRGIGRWTVEMLLIFQLGRPDVLPVDDFGVRAGFQFAYGLRKMPAPKALAAYGERWGPHRSAAAWYLWRAVELKRAGKLPEPVEKVRLLRIKRRARPSAKKAVRTGAGKPARPKKKARKAAVARARK